MVRKFLRLNSFRKPNRDEILAFSLVMGALGIIFAIVLLTPAKQIFFKPIRSFQGDKKGISRGSSEERGMVRIGDVLFSLGAADEFIDSDIDLEFDKVALAQQERKDPLDSKAAENFFEKMEARIKDSLLTSGSYFDSEKVKAKDGMKAFKEDLVDAVNNAISKRDDIVTDVYFRRFILVPKDNY